MCQAALSIKARPAAARWPWSRAFDGALRFDATRLAMQAGAANVATRLEIWPNMVHVWHLFGFVLSEGRRAVRDAGAFLDGHMSASAD
jgi:acetyl esterase/lipase